MRHYAIAVAFAVFTLASTLAQANPALAGPRCGYHHHWVGGHYAYWGGHRHWVSGHCV
jgi:hypothetical protein